jgi:hypothetical protein
MKKLHGFAFVISIAALGVALGDDPLDVSADCPFSLDSMPVTAPRSVKTAADLAALPCASYRVGDVITTIAPDGTTSVSGIVANAQAALPFDSGGFWTFTNSPQGTAMFVVRHSLCGTLGDGTVASPAKIVDGDELVDYVAAGTAGTGYVFTLDGEESLLNDLLLPTGYKFEMIGDALWRLVPSQDGCLYQCAHIRWSVDSKQDGPDRKTLRKEALPIAYTGDNWARAAAAVSSLTLVSPSGATATHNLAGTGARSFTLAEQGDWTVTLAMADGSTLTSTVTVNEAAFILVVR